MQPHSLLNLANHIKNSEHDSELHSIWYAKCKVNLTNIDLAMRGAAPIMPNDEWKLQMVGWPKNAFTMTTNAKYQTN